MATSTGPAAAGSCYRLHLLGGFDFVTRRGAVALPGWIQRFVAWLAIQSRPVPRGRVAAELWIDVPESRAQANLRTALWHVRQLVGQPAPPVIEVHGPDLRLARAVTVDVRETIAQAHRVLRAPAEHVPVDVATSVFSQVLLPGWYDEWVLAEQVRLRQLCLHSLEVLTLAFTARGHHGRAVEAAMTAVQADPLRESARRTLILAHLGEGNRSDAMRAYSDCVVVLDRQLGLAPSPELQRLVVGITAA